MNDWSIRPHCETDLESLLALFAECFKNSKLTRAYLTWLYDQNPDGQAIAYNAVTSDQVVIGHYALIPRSFLGAPNLLLSVNTATHPKYGRKGIFGQLAVKSYEHAATDGYSGVVGVANGNSIYTFINKLNFDQSGQLRLSVIPPLVFFNTNPIQTLSEQTFKWRMQHPSQSYFYSAVGELAHIYTYFKKMPCFLVSVPLGFIEGANVQRSNLKWSPTLSPVYQNIHIERKTPCFPIPQKLIGSPWHVIAKKFADQSEFNHLIEVNGLTMDSF